MLPCVLASYPYVSILAPGISLGSQSRSHRLPLPDVQVSSRWPSRPWTATILRVLVREGVEWAGGDLLDDRVDAFDEDLEAEGFDDAGLRVGGSRVAGGLRIAYWCR